jgi:hypothetical protein
MRRQVHARHELIVLKYAEERVLTCGRFLGRCRQLRDVVWLA